MNSSEARPNAGLSLFLGGLTISIPFLIPYHNYPLLTFYGEWAALFLGVLTGAVVLLHGRREPPLLPWLALGLIAFCVVLYVQMAAGVVAYPQRSITGVMYALWAALLVWCGAALRERFGFEGAFLGLALALAAGAWLLALTGFMQFFQIHTFFGHVVEGARQVGMYGVLGQRNLFANYVACGLLAVSFLFARGRMGAMLAALLALPLAAALAYAGSRSAWIYVAILLGASAWAVLRHRGSGAARGFWLALAATFVFALVRFGPAGEAVPRGEGLAPWEWLPYRGEGVTQAALAPRLLLAWHAWIQFLDHPMLGVGYGEFAWNLFQNAAMLDGVTPGIDRHSHNIVLHLLAETGMAGFAAVGLGCAAWAWGLRDHRRSPAFPWVIAIILVQLAHSLVEFPLWYAQFLGMTALFMGMAGAGGLTFGRSRLGRVVTWSIVSVGIFVSALFLKGYRDYEKWYQGTVTAEAAGKLNPAQQIDALLELKYSWMFSPYFDLVTAEAISMSRTNLEAKLSLNAQAMRLFPIPSAASRQAVLLALAGRQDEAWDYWQRMRIVYPMQEKATRARLTALGKEELAIVELARRAHGTGTGTGRRN